MSLLVWLPLNGDLKNYGLSNAKFSLQNGTNGLTFSSTNGKISSGMCRRTVVNTSDHIKSDIKFKLDKDFSMACWCKATTPGAVDSANGILTNHNHSDNSGAGITLKYISATDCRISCNTGDGSSRTYYTYYGTTNIYGAWHHLCLTYNKATTTYKLYVNGICEKTFTYGNLAKENQFNLFDWSVGYSSSANYRPVCDLNDVRLYDHCLSNKEVEELSKGLIAHYPLRGRINNNLITVMSTGARTTQNGKHGLNADFSQNLDTYGYFNVSPSLELNKTYTLSFDVSNFPDGGIWSWRLWNNTNYEFTVTGNGHYSFTFIPDVSKLPSGYELNKFLFDDGGRTNPANIVTFSNFKIEEGPIDSFWTPHSADDSYNAYSQLINRICDCSGNNYDLTIVGTNIYNAKDSVRNDSCINIPNGQNSYLKCDSAFFPYDKVTMNCWFKNDNGVAGAGGYHIPFASQSGHFEISVQTGGQLRTGVFVNGSRSVLTTVSKNVSDGNWHMLTMTYDGTSIKRYVDGEIVANSSTTIQGSLSGGNKLLTIGHYGTDGNYGNKNSYMSDVRLYATALNDEDILKLYQVGVAIDDSQNIYAYEFIENNAIDFKKNGTVNFELFTNEDKCTIHKNLLTSAYFIEI